MTHAVLTILMGVLLQPPATPATPAKDAGRFGVEGFLGLQPPATPATPAKPQPVPEPKPKSAVWVVDITVERSVANHPDVRVAEARLMEAQAALAQARLKVAIEMTTNQAKLDQAKAYVATQTEFFQKAEQLKKSGVQTQDEYSKATAAFYAAQADLALQDRLMRVVELANQPPDNIVRLDDLSYNRFRTTNALEQFSSQVYAPKPESQALRDLMQRKAKFAVKATDADRTVIGVLERSIKEWDFASAKVIVRYPQGANPLDERTGVRSGIPMQPVEGENAIGVWLMMMLDDFNAEQERSRVPAQGKYQIYVREYGLLFALTANAPDGAPTLAEFLRQPKK